MVEQYNIYENTYEEALRINEKFTNDWLKHKKSLEELLCNLDFYPKKLSHQVMVPLGKKAFVQGKVVHTNEVLISIGANMFIKRSAFGAKEVCNRIIKRCDEQLNALAKEKELLLSNRSAAFDKELFGRDGQVELIEPYDEEAEKQWRVEHREKIKNYKMREKDINVDITYEEAMRRLETLELREELEEDLTEGSEDESDFTSDTISDDEDIIQESSLDTQCESSGKNIGEAKIYYHDTETIKNSTVKNLIETKEKPNVTMNKNLSVEMESKSDESSNKTVTKRVSFSNELVEKNHNPNFMDDDNVPVIHFKHSEIPNHPNESNKNSSSCINSPSDIYKLFNTPTETKLPKSILKRNESVDEDYQPHHSELNYNDYTLYNQNTLKHSNLETNTFKTEILGDIVERKPDNVITTEDCNQRRMSKFKSSRKMSKHQT